MLRTHLHSKRQQRMPASSYCGAGTARPLCLKSAAATTDRSKVRIRTLRLGDFGLSRAARVNAAAAVAEYQSLGARTSGARLLTDPSAYRAIRECKCHRSNMFVQSVAPIITVCSVVRRNGPSGADQCSLQNTLTTDGGT